jgi:hypothetical protein
MCFQIGHRREAVGDHPPSSLNITITVYGSRQYFGHTKYNISHNSAAIKSHPPKKNHVVPTLTVGVCAYTQS